MLVIDNAYFNIAGFCRGPVHMVSIKLVAFYQLIVSEIFLITSDVDMACNRIG